MTPEGNRAKRLAEQAVNLRSPSLSREVTCRHAIVAGEAQLPGFTVAGYVQEGAPFNPTWDHDWGEIVFIGNEELNVFFVDASVLADAWGVKINASAGQTVIVNVNGSDAEITYMS